MKCEVCDKEAKFVSWDPILGGFYTCSEHIFDDENKKEFFLV